MKSAKFLFDVNALLALGVSQHQFHARITHWVSKLSAKNIPEFATCPISELGFVRVLAQAPQYGFTVGHGLELLARMKASKLATFTFLTDNHGVSHLPAWVRSQGQLTDGHLAELAKSQGFQLATLDERIPGVFLIPHLK